MATVDAYGHPNQPWSTDFGDDVFGGVVDPIVHRQPANGTVTISGTAWRLELPALPALNSGMVNDSWEFVSAQGGTPVTVNIDIYNVA